jgi:hypothetical protein
MLKLCQIWSHQLNFLQSIPWDKVDITIVNLEIAHLGDKNPILEQFMLAQGYFVAERIEGQDIVFMKKSQKSSG